MQVAPRQHWPMLQNQLSGGLHVAVGGANTSAGQRAETPVHCSGASHIGFRAGRHTKPGGRRRSGQAGPVPVHSSAMSHAAPLATPQGVPPAR
jgi:hypothetical protein